MDDKKEEVKVVALDEDDSEGEELNPAGSAAESQPRNPDKVKGLQPISVLKKKAANKAKQAAKRGEVKQVTREEMTPAQLKARQRELEENSDMMAAMSTFGIEAEDGGEDEDDDNDDEEEKSNKSKGKKKGGGQSSSGGGDGVFDGFSEGSSREAYGKLANRVATKLLEYQGNLHYMYLVTELAKNLCTAMSVEEIAEVVAAMEVVKNAKRTVERGGKKKKKGPAVKTKAAAAKEDMYDDEYDSFL